MEADKQIKSIYYEMTVKLWKDLFCYSLAPWKRFPSGPVDKGQLISEEWFQEMVEYKK